VGRTERIKYDKQIDADDGEGARSIEGVARLHGVHRLVDSNVEHGECLASRSDQETPLDS
jgi:hypothetical protein